MRIITFFTGGTIGSRVKGAVVDTAEEATPILLREYSRRYPNHGIDFQTQTICSILSENMTPVICKQIYDALSPLRRADCDGIILTHGTDTLAYTAAFLSMVLCAVDVPILLVSANAPLEDRSTNGFDNFIAAVDFIRTAGTQGVYVPFSANGAIQIHLGYRIQQAQAFTHTFQSLGGAPYGFIENHTFVRNNHPHTSTPASSAHPPKTPLPCCPVDTNIVFIPSYPGLNYEIYHFSAPPAAILLGLYHSGTACAAPLREAYSVTAFARKCLAHGIPVFAAPYDSRNKLYASAKEMQEAGIRFLCDMSLEAAYVKLYIAYGSFDTAAERQRFLENDLACRDF
ncbi:MAG: asparaginase [Oscillospiraceae bacterium]|jgi:L-asparaginase|nr:asparaginase [Oscillospiraceae bacterium]